MKNKLPRFRREFSVNLYKNLKYPIGEVSLSKDWVNTKRGDPYPLISSSGDISEIVGGGVYRAESRSDCTAEISRFAFGYFPYATYEADIISLKGEAGFAFRYCGDGKEIYCSIGISVTEDISALYCRKTHGGEPEVFSLADRPEKLIRFVCTARPGYFDIYIGNESGLRIIKTFSVPAFAEMRFERTFRATDAEFYTILPAGGYFETNGISTYMDSGVSQADIRPIRYEDGSPMITDGRIYFTMSSRGEAGAYQSVISWAPSSSDFRLEGAIFFDTGDGAWCNDVASSVIYDRRDGRWLIWYCSFSHGHILGRGVSVADLRHGINIIDAILMDIQSTVATRSAASDLALGMTSEHYSKATLNDDRLFFAKYGDEDPDFVYDKASGQWLMTICRTVEADGKHMYRYFLFRSDDPFNGYKYVTSSDVGDNTGGSIVKLSDGYVFVCGSDFGSRSRYYCFDIGDFTDHAPLDFDHDDGGFRGWGTIMSLPYGSRTMLYHITFDRHCGSDYNWSYGNIYLFSAYPI